MFRDAFTSRTNPCRKHCLTTTRVVYLIGDFCETTIRGPSGLSTVSLHTQKGIWYHG
jgi:hypothetical protein